MALDQMKEREWHSLQADEVLKHLEVQEMGLSSEEVEKRLAHYGPNQLREAPRPGFLALLWAQLNNFVVILLIVASVISALLGDYVEAAAIMGMVLRAVDQLQRLPDVVVLDRFHFGLQVAVADVGVAVVDEVDVAVNELGDHE